MIVIVATPKRIIVSTLIHDGPCYLASILIGTDDINDPVVAAYNDADASDPTTKVIPSATYDAAIMGLNGVVLKFMKDCNTSLYVSISNIGSGEVVVDYRPIAR